MSRSQQSQVLATAQANSGADQTTAQNAQQAEVADIGNYEKQLSQYAADNPYKAGGEYDTATDSKLSGVADVGSSAIANQLATQAKRTGENATAANATAAEVARANERELAAGEAGATQTRIGDEANYNAGVLQDTAAPVAMEAGVANPALSASNSALGIGGDAAKTPGFWDSLGTSFAQQLGKTAGGGNIGKQG